MRKFSPIELSNSLTKSRVYFCHIRWNGRRVCIKCHCRKIYRLSNNGYYKCSKCKYWFNDFSSTYLGTLRINLDIISHMLYLFVLGVPAYRVRFYVPISLKTIERTFRIFRLAIYDFLVNELQNLKLSGEIEIDEALFGGRKRGGKRGWGSIEHKNLVFGIYKRNGIVVTSLVSDRKHKTLIPLIKQHTTKGSLYYSDEHTAYTSLELIGKHKQISHNRDEYVRDDTHINGIEGFWSYAKTWLYQYRGINKQYFHSYLKEIEFRFNNRNENLFDLTSKLLVKLVEDK